MEAWHTMTPGQACAALKSDLTQGLSPGEVKLRLEEQGPNELNRAPKTPLLRRLWEQLRDPMILVLLAAAAVSYLASRGEDWLDTMIILLIGTHIFMTIRTKGIQRKLGTAIKLSISSEDKDHEGDVSQFQALTTALASTIGTGNIVGVGTGLLFGGPGAIFWMWITGVFGIATKYS